jgi:hypothetical protein
MSVNNCGGSLFSGQDTELGYSPATQVHPKSDIPVAELVGNHHFMASLDQTTVRLCPQYIGS